MFSRGKNPKRAFLARWRGLPLGGRTVFFRRVAAVLLALLAGSLALQPRPGPAAPGAPVLVTAHDLTPGHLLAPADVVVRRIPADLAPAGAFREPSAAVGRVLSGAARSGEPLTDTRFVGPELTRLTTGGPDHAAVPIRLAEPGVADLLHPGRRVDIVTTSTQSGALSVLAERAPVIALRPTEERDDQGRLVLVGLPREQAATVAAASITQSLTVTLR